MKTIKMFTLLLLIGTAAAAQSALYPFNVIIGGQTAELDNPAALFAKIKDPVSAGAAIKAGIETQMVIINAFPCDDSGTPLPGKPPAIIIIQGGNSATLAKTMDGKKMGAGNFIANVVAEGKTSRVFFTVQ